MQQVPNVIVSWYLNGRNLNLNFFFSQSYPVSQFTLYRITQILILVWCVEVTCLNKYSYTCLFCALEETPYKTTHPEKYKLVKKIELVQTE